MKPAHQRRAHPTTNHFIRACVSSCEAIRKAVLRTKEALWNEYLFQTGEHARVLRLALNEAEALAWQTDYPHLFFPVLATEKAQAAVSWHERQRALRRSRAKGAFAE